jgi:hypothetical protein
VRFASWPARWQRAALDRQPQELELFDDARGKLDAGIAQLGEARTLIAAAAQDVEQGQLLAVQLDGSVRLAVTDRQLAVVCEEFQVHPSGPRVAAALLPADAHALSPTRFVEPEPG